MILVTIAVWAVVAGLRYVTYEIFNNDLPSCDREPVVLEWTQQEGRWQRSATFELFEDSQTVQVDMALYRDDGGFLHGGKTVYVVAVGGSVPADIQETPRTTEPFPGIVVGHGLDGVNEQVTLEAGQWQLIVRGRASAPEVRWPC